ncbi:hypothetical protein JTE90_028831 [Oedothorax gibbosus]|uniref:Uncharacterized protein n=1 Tax=Oedothorax gibbosus TaxID=931172 RepID=A0AAV6VX56_9ARAC|nr:hypothetical protein JTE90_028831 [Oedothorax gibbosus]
MAEGGSACPCNGAKKKSGVFKMFRLKKKKKADCTCIKCIQKNINFTTSQYTMDAEKERMMMAEAKRKEPNYTHEAQYKEPNYAHIAEAQRKEPIYVEIPDRKQKAPYPEEDIIEYSSAMSPQNAERRLVSASSSRELAGMPPDEPLILPLKYHPHNCVCDPCKQKRYDDSLLAMDAQVILQNSLLQNTITDTAGLVCVIF